MSETGESGIIRRLVLNALVLFAVAAFAGQAGAQSAHKDDFVRRSKTELTLDGTRFRYSGPNIEWLGLEGYGPHDPMGPRYPSHFEIDDAFATAAEMGARVVRSQTMGDTVGCARCIEPEEGKFNESAFQASDYALLVARQHGMKVIVSLVGDCAMCAGGGIGQYLAWEKKQNPQDFFTDPALIGAFEKHIDAVLNHINPLTKVRYKDDSTIMAWENCNMCGLVAMLGGGGGAGVCASVGVGGDNREAYQRTGSSPFIPRHVRSISHVSGGTRQQDFRSRNV